MSLGDPAWGSSFERVRDALASRSIRHIRPGLMLCEICYRRHEPPDGYEAAIEYKRRDWHKGSCELSLGSEPITAPVEAARASAERS